MTLTRTIRQPTELEGQPTELEGQPTKLEAICTR